MLETQAPGANENIRREDPLNALENAWWSPRRGDAILQPVQNAPIQLGYLYPPTHQSIPIPRFSRNARPEGSRQPFKNRRFYMIGNSGCPKASWELPAGNDSDIAA
jgi:hypothetical protein